MGTKEKILNEAKNRSKEHHILFNETTNTTPEERSKMLINFLKSSNSMINEPELYSYLQSEFPNSEVKRTFIDDVKVILIKDNHSLKEVVLIVRGDTGRTLPFSIVIELEKVIRSSSNTNKCI